MALYPRKCEFLERLEPPFYSILNSYDWPSEPQLVEDRGEGSSRRRVMTEAPQPQPRAKSETIRLRTMSETAQSRTKAEAGRRRPISTFAKPETSLGPIPQSPIEVAQRSPTSGVAQQRPNVKISPPGPQVYDPPPSKPVILRAANLNCSYVDTLAPKVKRFCCF